MRFYNPVVGWMLIGLFFGYEFKLMGVVLMLGILLATPDKEAVDAMRRR